MMPTVTDAPASPCIPHSREAEEAVIGSALIDPDAIRLVAWLKPDAFYIHRNRWIWEAMVYMDEKGVAVDLITIGDELVRRNYDVQPAYITSLITQTPTSLNIEHHAQIVANYAERRTDIQIANKIASGAYSKDGVDRAAIIDMLTRNTSDRSGALPLRSYLSAFYEEVVERSKSPCEVWGISSGISGVDKATGGWQAEQTTLLAGSPGVGKTTLMLQFMLEAAKHGYKVGIYELEMDAHRLLGRIVQMLTSVEVRAMKTGKMDNHWENFNRGIEILEGLSIYICDNPVMNTSQVRADVARIKARHGLDLVGLDYLNLLTDADGDDKNDNATNKAVRFRQICREFKVAGLSIQSVTKEGMKSLIPTLADMSGPAEIAFSADNVFFMVQDEAKKTDYTLLPAKLRDGDLGRVPVQLRRPQGKILFGEAARMP